MLPLLGHFRRAIDMKIRDFWKSWEFLGLLGVGAVLAYILPFNEFSKQYCLLTNAYVLSRAIYKTGRGLTYSSCFSSESYASLISVAILFVSVALRQADSIIFGKYIVATYAVFSLSRGMVKKIRDQKTTVLMR